MAGTGSLRAALVQLSVSDDAADNLPRTQAMVAQAADAGATLVLTPEATNLLSPDARLMDRTLVPEARDPTLAALREQAARLGVWLSLGSLLLRADDPGPGAPFVNRGFLIAPDGAIAARYDKIHMFDVDLPGGAPIRESARYRPGDRAVLADGPAPVGLSICYDLRFPHLYRNLAQAGAALLVVPAAFHPDTGRAHWHVLLRARAIETGCFVLAAAQTGSHAQKAGSKHPSRRSFGHSLAVDPWGNLLADAGDAPGVTVVDLDLAAVNKARSHIPSLSQTRDFTTA